MSVNQYANKTHVPEMPIVQVANINQSANVTLDSMATHMSNVSNVTNQDPNVQLILTVHHVTLASMNVAKIHVPNRTFVILIRHATSWIHTHYEQLRVGVLAI